VAEKVADVQLNPRVSQFNSMMVFAKYICMGMQMIFVTLTNNDYFPTYEI
jgi:hypothetical protein